jgi:hypothetical protein
MKRTQNRRLAARLACALIVQYRTGRDWHPAAALDLTELGCRIRIGEDIASRAPVVVRFEAPLRDGATSTSIEADGSVMWCRLEGLSWQAGIRFAERNQGVREILRELEAVR